VYVQFRLVSALKVGEVQRVAYLSLHNFTHLCKFSLVSHTHGHNHLDIIDRASKQDKVCARWQYSRKEHCMRAVNARKRV
jgi:hypothetical protein